MPSVIDDVLSARLKGREIAGCLRSLPKRVLESGDFCSNDYLGFARSHKLSELQQRAYSIMAPGSGSTGSRLLSGNSHHAERVELKLAKFFKSEKALLFNSGYSLNLGLLQALVQSDDFVLMDELMHASAKDGMRLGRGRGFFFRHNDVGHLKRRLESLVAGGKSQGQGFVVVESIYSMGGERAPLTEIAKICQHYSVNLIVDEAHAMGIAGPMGRGCVVAENIEELVFARVMTFGKAFGSQGAALLGKRVLCQYMLNFCHSFIYSTAMSNHLLSCIDSSLDFFSTCWTEKLTTLRTKQATFQRRFSLPQEIEGPIYSFRFSSQEALVQCCQELEAAGIWALPIRSPTVKRGTERLRICLHIYNTEREIEILYGVLKNYEASWKPFFYYRH